MRYLILLLCLAAPAAMADTVTFEWTTPTQREDNTALPLSEIANFRVAYTANGAAQTPFTVANSATTHTLNNVAAGRYCFTITTVDTDGLESVPTSEACRKARPKPPGGPRVR